MNYKKNENHEKKIQGKSNMIIKISLRKILKINCN